MRLRFLFPGLAIIAVVLWILFQFNESTIIGKLIPFVLSDENTPGYYADLISFTANEVFWIIILVSVTGLLISWRGFNQWFNGIENKLLDNRKITLSVVYASFIIITSVVATRSLLQFPNSADEYVYLFQAQQLGDGKLWDPVHPHPDFFEFHHLAQKEGKWIGRFPPGWPLLLSIAFVLGIPPFLVNTILALIALIVFERFVRRLYDSRIALWSVLTLAFSSFYIFNAATFFSHIASLLEGLLFVYLAYRFLQTQRYGYAIASGVFLGLLIMTRQLTALIIFLPVFVYVIYQLKQRAILPLLLIGLGATPFIGAFLWYNYTITGNAFVPVTMWTNSDEALGFVKGHTPAKGLKYTVKRLLMFIYFVSPTLLLLYALCLLGRVKNWKKFLIHPEDYIFVLLIFGYFFYYHSGGNQYGPRFYLEGLPFLIVFVVAKVLRSGRVWAKALLFASLIYSLVKIPFIAEREGAVVRERMDVYTLVKEQGVKNAVVFIGSETGVIRPMPAENLNRNDRFYKNDVIYARDLGEQNQELIQFYQGKDIYLYRRPIDEVRGILTRLNAP